MISYNNITAYTNVYLGSQQMSKVYIGANQVFPVDTKWLATYQDGHTEFAQCDSSSAISQNEITLTNLVSVELGNCITTIGAEAFVGCTSLTSVTIPNSVTSIDFSAFKNCSSLSSVTIPNSVTSIGNVAFYGCSGLTSITIPDSVTTIDSAAFYGCSGLTSITVNTIVPPELGDWVFATYNECPIIVPCQSLEAFKSADGWSTYADRITCVTPLFDGKFKAEYSGGTSYSADCDGNTSLTTATTRPFGYEYTAMTSAIIGDCVTSIANYPFQNCRILTSVTIPDSVTSIDYSAFDHCYSLTTITIPSGVTSIGNGAFAYCSGLTSVDIPSGVTTIGRNTFQNCSSLTSVTVPSGITSIGEGAFRNCSSLTSVTIPSVVTNIGADAFNGCSGLTSITCNAVTPPALVGYYVFDNTNCPVYVPCGSVETYRTTRYWDILGNRITCIPTPSYSGQYLTFIAEGNGTFKFSGNSIDYSLDSGSTWVTLPSNTNTPAIQSGQTIMWKGELLSAFGNVGTFSSSSNFSVEGNIMSLLYGDNFSGQTSLSGKNYMFVNLFQGCTTLTSAENLVLPATILSDSCYSQMFKNCTSLTTAPELPATTLANNCYAYMFQGCTNLTTAPSTLPATTLADSCYKGMFSSCTSLTTVPSTLPATTLATKCYYYMFQLCESLTTAPELPATTLAVECYNGMFQNCYNLTTAPVLSASTLVTKCYNSMFYNCTSLNSITCLATDISASNCTENWVTSVAASGTFVKAASMSSWTNGYNGIPNGWTVVDN